LSDAFDLPQRVGTFTVFLPQGLKAMRLILKRRQAAALQRVQVLICVLLTLAVARI